MVNDGHFDLGYGWRVEEILAASVNVGLSKEIRSTFNSTNGSKNGDNKGVKSLGRAKGKKVVWSVLMNRVKVGLTCVLVQPRLGYSKYWGNDGWKLFCQAVWRCATRK